MTRCGAYNSSKPSGREIRHVVIEHDLLDIGAFLFGQFVPFGLGLGLGGLNFEPSIYDLSAPLSVSLCVCFPLSFCISGPFSTCYSVVLSREWGNGSL